MAELVLAIAERRDRAAFAELFAVYAPRVKGYLMRLGSDGAQAEEVTQDVMLTLWRKADSFDRRLASVSTWVFTIARNRRIDRLRRERFPQIDADDPILAPAPPPSPDETIDQAQREERLRRAIAELPGEQADLLRRAFYGETSHRDLAAALGLPLGTVKSRLRLALARLRKAMDGEEGA
ncbi:MAG: sigma-70 family RNA polymerase sigma factor [Alphaproteobacteria bacterium]|nr:sigma-70 family RNA polymerase sigma factor [Alphaproteobacteria bacterium]